MEKEEDMKTIYNVTGRYNGIRRTGVLYFCPFWVQGTMILVRTVRTVWSALFCALNLSKRELMFF